MKPWLLRIFAFLVFGLSFALPAIQLVNDPAAPGTAGQNPIPGFFCAYFANYLAPAALIKSHGSRETPEWFLLTAAGYVNLLVLAILFLSIWPRLAKISALLAAATIPCFAATWVFFAKYHLNALAGHYLWVAGTLLFVLPEVVHLARKPAKPAAAVGA
jgi:hypothetical protein